MRQWDLSVDHVVLGVLFQLQRKFERALEHFRAAQKLQKKLVERDPSNGLWQHSLYESYYNIGDILLIQGDLDQAMLEFKAALVICERRVAAAADEDKWRRNLSISLEGMGKVLRDQGRLDEAVTNFRTIVRLREQLVTENPSNSQWKRNLATGFLLLGGVLATRGDKADAQAMLLKSADIYGAIAASPGDFYNAACVNALSGNSDRAFEMLDTAVQRGWRDTKWTATDSDLASLHADSRWKQLLEKMNRKQPKQNSN